MTNDKLKQCKEILSKLKRSSNSIPFKEPVDPIKLGLPDYFDKIKHPMDLSKIKQNLDSNKYKTPEQFKDDIILMFNNCYTYNEENSHVYKCAKELQRLFDHHYSTQIEAKENLISFLNEINKQKHRNFTWPFLEPVDAKQVPDYYTIIKNPIDLKTIQNKVNLYKNKEELKNDLDLMILNCFTYNLPGSDVYDCGIKLKKLIDSLFYEENNLEEQIIEIKSKILLLQKELDTLQAKQNKTRNYSAQERVDLAKKIESMPKTDGIQRVLAKYLHEIDYTKSEIVIDLRDLPNQAIEDLERFVMNVEEEETETI
ncbi:transcription factor [Tubulinosema ratisbonensis]|uniref:Transcription factor n=1 Tax=Tubulinosema ratisbonensis TaxID=291195 RepID=A0A437AN47_9MICR|nr:transcription factor [Tubulinosema ratisbonensis]